MKDKFKKLLTGALTLAMIFSNTPVSVLAEEDPDTSGDIIEEIVEDVDPSASEQNPEPEVIVEQTETENPPAGTETPEPEIVVDPQPSQQETIDVPGSDSVIPSADPNTQQESTPGDSVEQTEEMTGDNVGEAGKVPNLLVITSDISKIRPEDNVVSNHGTLYTLSFESRPDADSIRL